MHNLESCGQVMAWVGLTVIFGLFLLVISSPNGKRCVKEGTEYDSCGSPCPETCENNGIPPPCFYRCDPGCHCKAGLVLAPNGDCVKLEDCPK